jgi:hypothetical protein
MPSIDSVDFVFYILIWISLAELALQMVISELSDYIRGAMLLTQPYSQRLESLRLIKFWRKIIGNWWIIATPLILLINIHKFISNLLTCPYCLGFWIGISANYYYLNLDIITSIILAPMVLIMVAILDKVHTK